MIFRQRGSRNRNRRLRSRFCRCLRRNICRFLGCRFCLRRCGSGNRFRFRSRAAAQAAGDEANCRPVPFHTDHQLKFILYQKNQRFFQRKLCTCGESHSVPEEPKVLPTQALLAFIIPLKFEYIVTSPKYILTIRGKYCIILLHNLRV